MGVIGGILAIVGGIGMLVFWIMTLIRQFKGGDTVWGILSIFFAFLAPIWCFMNAQAGLGMRFVISLVLYMVGFGLMIAGGMREFDNIEIEPETTLPAN